MGLLIDIVAVAVVERTEHVFGHPLHKLLDESHPTTAHSSPKDGGQHPGPEGDGTGPTAELVAGMVLIAYGLLDLLAVPFQDDLL